MPRTIVTAAAAAALVAALAAPALAAPPVPATLNEQQDFDFAKKGETASFTYKLVPGDYAIGAIATDSDGDVVLTVRTPQGAPVATLESATDLDNGKEFHVKKAGTYTVTAKDVADLGSYPYPYRFILGPDCAAGTRTTCQLKVGTTQQRKLLSAFDVDWFRVQLQKGKAYALSYTGGAPPFILSLRDAKGKVVVEDDDSNQNDPLVFNPASTGTYFVSVKGTQDGGNTYQVTLKAK